MSHLRSTSESLRDDNPDISRRRLLFRCWHRGTKEGDLILGSFAETCLTRFDSAQLNRFEGLLECADTDLFDWIIGGRAPPREYDHDVMRLLRAFWAQPGYSRAAQGPAFDAAPGHSAVPQHSGGCRHQKEGHLALFASQLRDAPVRPWHRDDGALHAGGNGPHHGDREPTRSARLAERHQGGSFPWRRGVLFHGAGQAAS